MSEYDLHIEPIKGVDNVLGDAMSRKPNVRTHAHYTDACIIYTSADIMCVNVIASAHFHTTLHDVYAGHININTSSALSSTVVPVTALMNCTTNEESLLYSSISQFYLQDTIAKQLLAGEVKLIQAPQGKYVMLNNIIYYLSHDGKYLLYIPAEATFKVAR